MNSIAQILCKSRLLLGAMSTLAGACSAHADVELLSRYSFLQWTRDSFPYLDRGLGDWVDEATFVGPGLWEVTLPRGAQHDVEVTTQLIRGGFTGLYRSAMFAEIDTGLERLDVRLRFTEPTLVTIEFSAAARPIGSSATTSGNLTFALVDLATTIPVFDILRDGARTTEPGLRAVWSTQTWSRVVPPGEYDVLALAHHNDLDTIGDQSFADAQLDFRIVLGGNACQADFNSDGFVDFFDYDDFVTCFETGLCGEGRTADVNGDGFADFFDYDAYVELFERGC
jgi:hypothetical protein